MIARKFTVSSETIQEERENEEEEEERKSSSQLNVSKNATLAKRKSRSRVSFCSHCRQDDDELFFSSLEEEEEETSFCVPPISSSEPDSFLSTKSEGAIVGVQQRRRKIGMMVAKGKSGSKT